jgi:small subunit ribosomal protein S20
MPQIKAAKKALHQSARKRLVNDRWRRKFRNSVKAVQAAVVAGDKKAAEKLLPQATSHIDRASRRNILHPNTASRKKSRLARAVQSLS